jgi:hypothetical protein
MKGTFHVPESWPTTNRHLPGCVACGYGDNSAHHWGRFCIVPILVVKSFLPNTQTAISLDQAAWSGSTGCILASHVLHQFRRLLLEHGGMQHSSSSVSLNITEWLTRLRDNCIQAIPARHLHDCLPLLGRRHVSATEDQPCHMQITNNDAVTLQSVMLPDLLCTATTAIAPQQIIATLPLGHP